MKNMLRKIFNLSDIRYSWLLLISMGTFVLSLYNEKINPDIAPITQWLTYGFAILSAVIWSILNYIAHIKVSANYKKFDNIETYVDNLIMSKDEKLELKAYLEDFSADLLSQGKSKEDAVQTAINQFRIQEFTSLSKNSSVLNLPIHYYLIGYLLLDILIIIILTFITSIMLSSSFWLLAFEFMFILYGVGFLGLFFLYKMLDSVISKNLNN
jgi:drug/metabolite transporter (DMT)-like permease